MRNPFSKEFRPACGGAEMSETYDVWGCVECGELWDEACLGRTKTCPNCGGKCEFREVRDEDAERAEVPG